MEIFLGFRCMRISGTLC